MKKLLKRFTYKLFYVPSSSSNNLSSMIVSYNPITSHPIFASCVNPGVYLNNISPV